MTIIKNLSVVMTMLLSAIGLYKTFADSGWIPGWMVMPEVIPYDGIMATLAGLALLAGMYRLHRVEKTLARLEKRWAGVEKEQAEAIKKFRSEQEKALQLVRDAHEDEVKRQIRVAYGDLQVKLESDGLHVRNAVEDFVKNYPGALDKIRLRLDALEDRS